jgi:hypothetical protein
MRINKVAVALLGVPALGILLSIGSPRADAHCDTMNGPVIKAARHALETGDVRFVLRWIPAKAEQEIRSAFDQTRAVRALGAGAAALADKYFFETTVRIHRAGEGVPYTGLQPEGAGVDEGIEAADRSLEQSSVEPVVAGLTAALSRTVATAYHRAHEQMSAEPTDVAAGRRFVEAYVSYIHYVERLHQVMNQSSNEQGHAQH